MPTGVYPRTKEMYFGRGVKISIAKFGHIVSQETRKKISRTKMGVKLSAETRKRMSIAKKINPPRGMLGKCHSESNKKKWSRMKKGEKSHLWRGGITKNNDLIRHSLTYKLWRKKVFIRDNYTCIWCGVRSQKGVGVILNADHIKPFAYYPKLRFDVNNGRTLCVPCHKKTTTYKKRLAINNKNFYASLYS